MDELDPVGGLMKNRTALLLTASFATAALTLAGCTVHDQPLPPPPPPTTSAAPVVVSGSVVDDEGAPDASAVVAFARLDDVRGSTASTYDDGSYELTLEPGQYVASCVSLDGDCAPDGPAEVDVSGPVNVDFLVTRTLPVPAPPDACGVTVCGQVFMNGEPMSGVVVEFGLGDTHQTATTDDSGTYRIDLELSVATAVCVEPDDLLDQHYICGAVGTDGGPVTVDSSETGRVLDFMLCPSDDYPACLQES
jgi:hypothetical protein